MKKYLRLSLIFAVYGLLSGVYFRELTKFNGFTERTMLGMAHPHILMLGMGGFLLIALFVKVLHVKKNKKLAFADGIYIAGIVVTSVTMLLRGTFEVLGTAVSAPLSGALAGVAGLGHIATAIGILCFLGIFRRSDK